MGNSPQKPAMIEVKIGNYSYPEPRKHITGVCSFNLCRKPKPCFPLFNCPRCGRENFDGGLCQKVSCACGVLSSREGTEEHNSTISPEFWDCFENCSSKRYAEVCELETITIGIFERGIPSNLLQRSNTDYESIFKDYLQPYFIERTRCISNKDFFKSKECYFKVMSCVPDQGFVTRTTQILCYKMLSDRNIYKIEVSPLAPHRLSEELFESLILPFFRTARHVHEDQILNINGLECVISKSEPWNGVITPDSHIEFNQVPFPGLERLKLVPYFEDLPSSLKNLDANTLVQNIINSYLMPHLKGWNRLIYPGKLVSIAGIEFKVLESVPNKGVLSNDTIIFYDGKGISRREERRQERASAPRNNRIIIRQILTMLDSMRQLTEEFSENLISTLPVFVLDVVPSSSEQKSCLICMNDFDIGHQVRALPCCKFYLVHIFHTECTDNWLRRNKVCPTCKNPCDGLRDYE